MLRLYDHASRDLPFYFPRRPLEELYDPDLRVWKELLHHGKARIHRDREQLTIQFSDELDHSELQEYRSAMPQTVKYRRRGKMLIVENPESFETWLRGGDSERSWVSRLLRRG